MLDGRTRGGLRYSTVPTLFALRDVLVMSLSRLYRSILKLNVGPLGARTMRNEGAMSVRVNASRWVTPRDGAMLIKSFSLFR